MTTTTTAPFGGSNSSGSSERHAAARGSSRHARTAAVGRIVTLGLVDARTYIGIPWIIVAMAFVVSIAVAQIARVATDGDTAEFSEGMRYSWAVVSPMWYLVVVAVQAITYTFPYALGLGATRRDFYLGVSALFVLISAGNAVAFTILVQIEKATGGWWSGARMFDALWFGQDGWYVDLFAFFMLQISVLFVGASTATIYMRWRMWGMLVFWAALAVLLLGAGALITFTQTWGDVGRWLSTTPTAEFFGWLVVPTLVVATLGFLVLRRATPR